MMQEEHLPPGTLIDGKYELERPIGVGGMGAVYFATQKDLGRRVAIKLLHPHFRSDSDVIERFHREARLAASIGHDNICEVTDFGIHEDGAPYLVMPVLKGASLADILKRERLDIGRVCDIMRQVLSALDAAHVAGVVHRDLKPDNIFISQMGDRKDFVKLLDFGISKVMESGAMNELTRTGTVMGTPVYMAPEQARGEKNVDHRLDIYAAGVIMYEALTGRRPHDGDSYNEIVFKIIAEPYPPPRNINPQIPKKLEKIVLKAMSKDPEGRFVGAKEMGDAIRQVMDVTLSRSAMTGPGTVVPVQATAKAERSHRHLIPILVILVVLIAGGIATTLLLRKDEQSPTYINITNRSAFPDQSGAALPQAGEPKVMLTNESLSLEDNNQPEKPPLSQPENEASSTPPTSPSTTASKAASQNASEGKKPSKGEELSPSMLAALASGADTNTNGNPPQTDQKAAADNAALALPTPAAASPPSVSLPVKNTTYTNMNQLKAAFQRGELTRDAYAAAQTQIRAKRAAELDRLKADYRAGKITRDTYNIRAAQIKQKYETGTTGASDVAAAPSTPASASAPTATPPAPTPASAVTPSPPPPSPTYTNMQQLKTALRQGTITRADYAAHQAKIREARAAEYDRIKADYRAGKITRAEYNQKIDAAKRKYEGN